MRNTLVSILARVVRPMAVAVIVACGALSLPAPAVAGGWHGGGWHGGGWGGGWHGGGWHGGCCWGGSSFSLFFGFPAYDPFPAYYPYPAYSYYPPYPYPAYSYGPSYYPPAPPVSVAQQAQPPGPPPVQYWYYCNNPRGYYPYVQSCGAGWRPVPAQPPGVQTPP